MSLISTAQSEDEQFIRKIFDEALTNQQAYKNLRVLCKQVGHRLSGSPAADKAIKWGEDYFKSIDTDSVWKQKLLVNNWKRGLPEIIKVTNINIFSNDRPINIPANGINKIIGRITAIQKINILVIKVK